MKLYHYTTIDTLAYILDSKSIKFSRLDQLDDKMESEPFADFNPLSYIFSCSFTNDATESIPMWKMYANMETGIRLEFESDTMFSPNEQRLSIPYHEHECCEIPQSLYTAIRPSDILNSDYILCSWSRKEVDSICQCIKLKKVEYIDDFQERYKELLKISNSNDGVSRQISYSPKNFGFYKSSYWAFQKEVRFLIYATPFLKNKKEISDMVSNKKSLKTKNIFVPLSEACLMNLKIILAPKITEASRLIVKALLSHYAGVSIEDSCLSGTIR